MKRFKTTSSGYVFDRLLFLAGLTPLFLLLLLSGFQSLNADYSFFLDCRGSGGVFGSCENPFWPDCPRVVEREASFLCSQRTLSSGEYGSRPGWAWDWLFPAFVAGFGFSFGLNHYWWNRR